ncbi:hypothetical protein RUR49_11770 [Pseudoxanthobacter sp. M-2]|uniref:hypothetical protein n=1 Tax=Pseudoxanthobacter sp. M-2 TaxID=3078754 RepID=UPI0038FBEBCC
MTSGAVDSVTVLYALHGILPAKVFRGPNLEKDPRPQNEWHWRVETREFRDLETLHAVLAEVSATPTACVIRGAPLDDTDRSRTRRRKEHFADVPRRWAMLDFDGIAAPDGLDWLNRPAETVAFLQSLLPAAFQGVGCRFNYSGSAGTAAGGGIRMHLWFIFDRPVSNAALKAWLGDLVKPEGGRLVDPALFRPVQPHFTAAPLFLDGARDPVPLRSGIWRSARDVVAVGEVAAWHEERQPREAVAPVGAPTPRALAPAGGGGFDFYLSRIGDHADGFHEPASRAAGAWFAARRGRDLEEAELLLRLTDAMRAAPVRPGEAREAERQQRIADLPRLVADIKRAELSNVVGSVCPPPIGMFALPFADAERDLAAAVRAAFAEIEKRLPDDGAPAVTAPAVRLFDPLPCLAITADLGLGKTRSTVAALVELAARRPHAERYAYFVPTITLAEQVARDLDEMAGRRIAGLWRGATQPDPADASRTMCRRAPELVEAVHAAGDEINTLCKGCPFHPRHSDDPCGYLTQSTGDERIIVMTTAMLAHARPEAMRGRPFSLAVVDELNVLSFVIGVTAGEDDAARIRVDLRKLGARRRKASAEASNRANDYDEACARLKAVVAQHDARGEPLSRPRLEAADLTGAICKSAAGEVRNRWALPIAKGGSDAEILRAIRTAAEGGNPPHHETLMWRLLGDFLAGDGNDQSINLHATGGRYIDVAALIPINKLWLGMPMLVLDATLDEEIARQLLPNLQVTGRIAVQETAVYRVVVIGQEFSKAYLRGGRGGGERQGEHGAHLQSIAELIAAVAHAARADAGNAVGPLVGCIVQKEFVEPLRSHLARLKASDLVIVMHFNNVRGRNDMARVRVLFDIGRPLPQVGQLEKTTEVFFGRRLVGAIGGGAPFEKRPAALRMRDGTGRRVEVRSHPDARANRVLGYMVDGEVRQADGRGRGVRRTAENPLLVVDMTGTASSPARPIDEVVAAGELIGCASPVRLLSGIGIIPADSAAAAKLLDWSDSSLREAIGAAAAGPNALARITALDGSGPAGVGSDLLRTALTEPTPADLAGFRSFTYRAAGRQRARQHRVLIDVRRHRDPRAALEAALGPLASFEPAEPPQWLADAAAARRAALHARLFGPAPAPAAGGARSISVSCAACAPGNVREVAECARLIRFYRRAGHLAPVEIGASSAAATSSRDGGFRSEPGAPAPFNKKPTDNLSPPTFTLPVIARALGFSARAIEGLRASPRVKSLKRRGLPMEKAILLEMRCRVGEEKFGEAIKGLTADKPMRSAAS